LLEKWSGTVAASGPEGALLFKQHLELLLLDYYEALPVCKDDQDDAVSPSRLTMPWSSWFASGSRMNQRNWICKAAMDNPP
jgi:hypothetical protein